ncbi:COP1-interacting protein 7 isoform X2 [Mercurialis annua]|uniref:COP1-interacting protein 7 isoform X2 n=1 Tax=Mercurialis annua TaxID=3986 RepID=UPI00215F6F05|nr:COP1-interacting protein 7 isoform X2 [Mercurialis annua]
MKNSTRLDSAVFQLTPTRTRCDLVIYVNGKTEKIASGLVNPFLAHLKTAQDQMAKGGYSISLEPEPGIDAAWFTRGTIERFVRFVSTPEILERVYTLESEILQMEEAIAIQSNNDIGLNLNMVEDHQAKPAECIEGSKPLLDSNEEKAIVLYKPDAQQPAAKSAACETNSKVQLMKVLETRKTMLQKEQGMAFARAVAAGYDIDHMAPLMSFAESFGAVRLMDACVRFMDLWKRKHESGQWFEVEAAEAMASRSDFASMNASGIVLSSAINKQCPATPESNGKAGVDSSPGISPMNQQPSPSHQEYFQGQFPHPMYPPWPMHSPPGALPVFQGYPMQGIPYYQNYPGNGPHFQPPYPSGEDTRLHTGRRKGHRRHSMDSGDSSSDPESTEVDVDLENGTSGNRESGNKSSRSSKKHSGKVVIRNINYITSKRQSSGNVSESASGSATDEEEGNLSETTSDVKDKSLLRSSKRKDKHTKSTDMLDSANMGGTVYGNEADGGNWQAFQTYLLKGADEAEHGVDSGMFSMEKDVRVKRRQSTAGQDPLLLNGRDVGDYQEGNMTDMQRISGNLGRMTRGSNDASLMSRQMGQTSGDGRYMDMQYAEVDGREKDLDRSSSHTMNDDSYVVSLRSTSLDQVRTDGRRAIDMDSEFTSSQAENLSNRVGNQVRYEPDDLSLMPERQSEKGTIGYDPALDYELQVAENGGPLQKKRKDAVSGVGQGTKKVDKDRKSKLIPDTSDRKKTVGPMRKGKPSKLSPLDEAKARAERLRTFKADLQKMKKEREDEQIKRLEALKLERQKRIASRGSIPAQTRKQLPAKLSPTPLRGSKFSDSEPGSVSPLQRFPTRTVSAGPSDSLKSSKPSNLSNGIPSAGNRLSRSVSSLPKPKRENGGTTPEAKAASMARIRRLSEPKISSSNHVTSVKPRNTEPASKAKVSNGSESKKIHEIVNHDMNKIASLPELKIKTTKASDIAIGNSSGKEMTEKPNEGSQVKRSSDKVLHHNDVDDNPIIEKKVLVLESEKPSVPAVHTSGSYSKAGKYETASNYAAIRAPVSPLAMDGVDKVPNDRQLAEVGRN